MKTNTYERIKFLIKLENEAKKSEKRNLFFGFLGLILGVVMFFAILSLFS